jgi:hypothetical protein
MPRVPSYIDSKGPVEPGLDSTYKRLALVINGRISFGDGLTRDNIDGTWVNVPDTGIGNTDFTVQHNLGRLPVGYILMRTSLPTSIYDGSIPATTTEITLRSIIDNANVTLFIV